MKSKKIILKTSFFLIGSLLLVSTSSYHDVFAAGSISPSPDSSIVKIKDGVGYSYDFMSSVYFDPIKIKTEAPILDETWHSNLISTKDNFIYEREKSYEASKRVVVKASGLTYEDLLSNYQKSINGLSSDLLPKYYQNDEDAFFEKMSFPTTNSHYWYYYSIDCINNSYHIPYNEDNYADLIDNLHPRYKNNLEKVFSGSMSFNDFFDIYGTHFICEAEYGGKFEICFCITTNFFDINDAKKEFFDSKFEEIANAIENQEVYLEENETIYDRDYFNFNKFLGIDNETENIFCNLTTIGGVDNGVTRSISDADMFFSSWDYSVAKKPSAVRVTDDGLIPLWKLIPNNYTQAQKEQFKAAFDKYYNTKASSVDLYDENSFKYGGNNATFTFDLRSDTITVTDAGRWKNKHDVLNLKDVLYKASGYNVDVFMKNGFTTFDVIYTADMKEIDHEYQHIFIYKNELNLGNDSNLITSCRFELNGGNKQTSFAETSITFNDLNLNKLIDDNLLVFRYTASGSNDDDWQNKNAKISLILRKASV